MKHIKKLNRRFPHINRKRQYLYYYRSEKIGRFSLFLLIGLLFLVSCAESPRKEKITLNLDTLIYDKNGELYTGRITGKVGDITIEYEVVNGKKHGNMKILDKSGNIQAEGTLKENKNEGLWKYYYVNGQIESQGNFMNDKVEGEWTWYYSSGKVRETAFYKNGVRDGKATTYDEEGKIILEKVFENGTEIENDK